MKIIEKLSDIKVALIATIIPLGLMICWHVNNVGLPFADAHDFLQAAGKIVNNFYAGNISEGFYSLYAEKPWRPVSFYLFLFPLMLVSANSILFTFAAIHSIALFITIIYSYFILRMTDSSKSICLLGSIFIGTLSNSFFPGGMHAFAETILTPAVLATIFHLMQSNYLINKKDSFFALTAMAICITIRPIEAIIYLLPIITCFFYFGLREKVFKLSLIIKIIQFIFGLFLFAAIIKGIDISFSAKAHIQRLHSGQAASLYLTIVKYFSIVALMVFIPYIYNFFKNLFFWIKNSRKNNNESYVVIIFTSLSLIVFLWFIEAWRDLYIWIYQTNFGQVVQANELSDNIFNASLSFFGICISFFKQLEYSGLIPFLIIFFLTIIALLYKSYFKIKSNSKVFYYIFFSSIVGSIPVLISIQYTSRKFALTYILFILFGMLISISVRKFDKIIKIIFLSIIFIQVVSISVIISGSNFLVFEHGTKHISLLRKIDGSFSGYNIISGGNIANPSNYSFEPKIANLVDSSANNFKYNNSTIEIPFLHISLNKQGPIDIFTTNTLINLSDPKKKSYQTHLPIVLEKNHEALLLKNMLHADGVFLINPYGMMKKNQENISIFEKRLTESKHQQDFYYENLMLLYFKGELARRYGFVEYKCIDLTYRNNIREGCLLIKSSIEEN